MGKQETKAAESLSYAKFSAEHQTSVQLARESRRSILEAQSKSRQEFNESQNASFVSREFC